MATPQSEKWDKTELKGWFDKGKWKEGWNKKVDESTNHNAFAISYLNYPGRWQKAFAFLKNADLTTIEIGRYELDGSNVFALVSEYITKDEEDARLEAHVKYADIQYIVSGEEKMGIVPIEQTVITEPYDENRDVCFLDSEAIEYRHAHAENFFLFFPGDAHRPCVKLNSNTAVRKVVIKVRLVE